jgi:ribonuclease G
VRALREIARAARQFEAKAFLVLAAPNVIARLLDEQSQGLAELELQLKRPIRLQTENQYLQDNYDVVPL